MTSGKKHESPEAKAAALLRIETLVEEGVPVRSAVDKVAAETGMGVRTLFLYRKLTDFVPRERWIEVLSRKAYTGVNPRRIDCPADALTFIVNLREQGASVLDAYAQMVAVAAERQWTPVPSYNTVRRRLREIGHTESFEAARYKARRNAPLEGNQTAR